MVCLYRRITLGRENLRWRRGRNDFRFVVILVERKLFWEESLSRRRRRQNGWSGIWWTDSWFDCPQECHGSPVFCLLAADSSDTTAKTDASHPTSWWRNRPCWATSLLPRSMAEGYCWRGPLSLNSISIAECPAGS